MRGRTAKTPENVAYAQRRRAQGALLREIADELDLRTSTVSTWLNDPDGSKLKARKSRYDLVCVDCGGRVHGCDPGKQANRDEPVCAACQADHYATWTRDAIILAFQEWAAEHGRAPAAADWRAASETNPSTSHVQARFGSWNDGIEAAGLEAVPSGHYRATPRPGDDPAIRVHAVALYAQGMSSRQVAAIAGCSQPSVCDWARAAGIPVRPPGFGWRDAA